MVYPEEYGDLFLGTVVAYNKRRMGDNKICEFYFAFFSTAIAKKQRESNSGEESLKSLSRSEYKGEENAWNSGKVKKMMNSESMRCSSLHYK